MAQISIGVPVYNGAELLAECLECLRAQSFRDFEVVISDNGSADGSGAIAEDFARRDPRFRVIRQARNIGAVGNFMATLETARARCFMWRAHDDLSDANYLEALHGRLHQRANAVLAVGAVETADLDGGRPRYHEAPEFPGEGSLADGLRLLFAGHSPSWYYGLWRTAYLRDAFPRVAAAYPHAWAQDHLLLFPVLLRRAIAGTAETAFQQRIKRRAGAGRRREVPPLALAIERRRQFRRACLDELARMDDLSPVDRLVMRALMPLYVNQRVHRLSVVARSFIARARAA